MTLTPLTAKPLDIVKHIRHGFFTREGGVSKGIFASLNCGYGSGDDAGAVAENRARIAANLSVETEKLLTVYQIHSPNVVTVTETWEPASAPQADAMVTNCPNIALGILTADCAPVLFADKNVRVIGAAHAGWKGALGGVMEATIEAMLKLGASRENIVAAIGPCITRGAYEVGPEFRDRFLADSAENERWFIASAREGYFMFDLPGYAEARLIKAELNAISVLGKCTYQDEKSFFSFRRATHRGESDYGRQISAISLRAEG